MRLRFFPIASVLSVLPLLAQYTPPPPSSALTNPMTDFGDMITGGASGTPARLGGNTTTNQLVLTQTGDGTDVVSTSWQPAPASGSLTYYFTNTASSIATYLQQTSAPFSPKTTLSYASLPTGTDTLKNWATNASVPGLTFIPAGVYVFHVHALRTGGGTVTVHCQFWEVGASGVDIAEIGQSEDTPPLGTGELEYELAYVDGNTYTMASTASRIVARVFAVVSGSSPTVEIFVGGTADSHISLPSNTVDATNFVPYSGATQNLDLGAFNILAANCCGSNPLHSISFTIDGGGTAISTGAVGLFPTAAFACTISRWDLSADQSGTITIDVWKAAGAIPTSGDKISASAPLTLSSAQLAQNGDMTGWTTTVNSGDVFGFSVATAITVTKVTGQIWCQ